MGDEDIELTAEEFTIHASEKVSTGDYETASVSMTVEGSIEGVDVVAELSDDLRARLHAIQRQLQRDVEQAAMNRVRDREFEKWGPNAGVDRE
jgi:hypothetical protein